MGSPNFLSNCQGLEKFKEHEACWELRKRGSVGESIIHLAMLGIKLPIFRNIVRSLLHHFPKLALDVYEGNEYKGNHPKIKLQNIVKYVKIRKKF